MLLTSCDSTDDVPVIEVRDTAYLNDAEILKYNYRKKNTAATVTEKNQFYFGFDLRNSPQEDVAQYIPFLKYLESATGYKFKLYLVGKNSSVIYKLGTGDIHFAAMGAVSFIKTQLRYGADLLVQGLNKQNRPEYRSYLVTQPISRIKSLVDIRGKRVAFGSKDSTQGYLIPRIILEKNGIDLKDLQSYVFTGSHQKCAETVVAGQADICGMQDKLAERYQSDGLLKILHRSAYYPSSGIVANSQVPLEVKENVKQALLAFDPKASYTPALYNWDKTEMPNGFIEANPESYEILSDWLKRLNQL